MFRNTFSCKDFIIELNLDRENKREKGETLIVRDTERQHGNSERYPSGACV